MAVRGLDQNPCGQSGCEKDLHRVALKNAWLSNALGITKTGAYAAPVQEIQT